MQTYVSLSSWLTLVDISRADCIQTLDRRNSHVTWPEARHGDRTRRSDSWNSHMTRPDAVPRRDIPETDRPTDHGNVSSNRPHLYPTHIRCGLKIADFVDDGVFAVSEMRRHVTHWYVHIGLFAGQTLPELSDRHFFQRQWIYCK